VATSRIFPNQAWEFHCSGESRDENVRLRDQSPQMDSADKEEIQATAVLGRMLARHCELLTNAAANRTIMPGHIEVLSQDYASPVPVQRAAGLRPEQRLPG